MRTAFRARSPEMPKSFPTMQAKASPVRPTPARQCTHTGMPFSARRTASVTLRSNVPRSLGVAKSSMGEWTHSRPAVLHSAPKPSGMR